MPPTILPAEDPVTALAAPVPRAGQSARQTFGGSELVVAGETAAAAMAAHTKALVEARFVMAIQRPRDWDDVRTRLLRACERPGFAGSATEKVWGAAWYLKPVGEGAQGFSVRFAEEAARSMGNLDCKSVVTFDSPEARVVQVQVLDLEANLSFDATVSIEKTVERSKLPAGEVALRTRTNASGKVTYTVRATDDEVFTRQQNLVSKSIRNGILRLLPGDIQSECRTRILAIRNGAAPKDPDKARKELSDGFAALNIPASELKDFIGHELSACTPAELADLRDLWQGLKAGEVHWRELYEENMESRAAAAEAREKEPSAPAPKVSGLDAVTERLKAGKEPTK